MIFDESRRDFIKKSIALGLGLYGITKLSDEVKAKEQDSSVVIARDKALIDNNFKVDYATVKKALDDAMIKVANTKTVASAWKKFFRSDDIVGIKINTLSGRWMSTHQELVTAIVEGLRLVGVKDIVIWDKSNQDLESAGYKINRKSTNEPRCFGTLPDIGYDSDLMMYGNVASLLSRITSYCTAFINVPVLKHHIMAGVTISLKNWFGAINNPHKYHFEVRGNEKLHVASCKYIPDLNTMLFSQLNKRQPLIICDALMAQYDNGPGYTPDKTWNYSGLIVSTDPVALDRIGTMIIEKKRKSAGLKSLSETGREPEYISIAADQFHRLGVDDPSKINIISAGNLELDI
ncbi:MAG: DUF362 domain-containing protein [bacterium]